METRFVPDAPATWLVYDLGALVLALPSEFRAAADAIAATPTAGVAAVLAALDASGIGKGAPFAVLESLADGLHIALRGPATVDTGEQTVTGLGADPWIERVVTGVAVTRLTVPGGEWTFTLKHTTAPESALAAPPFETSEITAFPDVELSLPPLPGPPLPAPPIAAPPIAGPPTAVPSTSAPSIALPSLPGPPPLGLADAEDRTVLSSELAASKADADDKTVVVDEIVKLRAKRSAGLAPPTTPNASAAAPAAPPVAPPAPRPNLSLELPDGSRQPLDAVVLVGRAPSAPVGAPASRLVRLEGDGDISRNHARVAVEGGTVVVTDLGSRNGTTVRIPGRPAQKLREGEPTPVLVDTVIDFGGGIEVSVREG